MNTFRKCLLLILVLAYAGQGFAAASPVCADMAPAGGMADMTGMAHAGHNMAANDKVDAAPAAGACCEGGLCTMSHCQSAPALPLSAAYVNPHFAAFYDGATETSSTLHAIDTPYRPPISR